MNVSVAVNFVIILDALYEVYDTDNLNYTRHACGGIAISEGLY